MAKHSTNRSSNGKDRISNVRIVETGNGSDSLHVDRMISQVKISESQTRILCGDIRYIDTATSTTSGVWDFGSLFATDDFTSMVQQYTEFRVRAIKFDVYDIFPSNTAGAVFSTFHDVYSATPTYTFANVVDGPDSGNVPPGTGKATWYWVAHGVTELGFQAASSTGSLPDKYGGFRYFVNSDTSPDGKFQLIVHAVVDFRGRV